MFSLILVLQRRAAQAAQGMHAQRQAAKQAASANIEAATAINAAEAPRQAALFKRSPGIPASQASGKGTKSRKEKQKLLANGQQAQSDGAPAPVPSQQELDALLEAEPYATPRNRTCVAPQIVDLTQFKVRRGKKAEEGDTHTPRQAAKTAQAAAEAVQKRSHAVPAVASGSNFSAQQQQGKLMLSQKDDETRATWKQVKGVRQQADAMKAVQGSDKQSATQVQQKGTDKVDAGVFTDEKRGKAYLQQILEAAYKSDQNGSKAPLLAAASDIAETSAQAGSPDVARKATDSNEPFKTHSLAELRNMRLVQELRPLCQNYGLTTTGRKDLVILRILAHEAGMCMSMGL